MLLRGGQSERRGELRKEEKSPVRRIIFNSENRTKCENLKKRAGKEHNRSFYIVSTGDESSYRLDFPL